MFRTQAWYQPWLRFVIVSLVMFSLIFSVWLNMNISFYGLVVFFRMICQLLLAKQNNQEIQQLVRSRIISAAEKKETQAVAEKQKKVLYQIHDYRKFRQELQRLFPHLKNQGVWTRIIWQIFLDLGFLQLDDFPPVYIEIPIFRPESWTEVEKTLSSLREQTYPAIQEIVLVFNDPENKEMEMIIKNEVQRLQCHDHRIHFVTSPIASKRTAMHLGFQRHVSAFQTALRQWLRYQPKDVQRNRILQRLIHISYQDRAAIHPHLNTISVNIDADTLVDTDAIALGVILLLLDPDTTAITSNVEIRNHNLNFLTKLTFARYKAANVIERAAQSKLKTVRCLSGPFMLFWTRNLVYVTPRGKSLADEWVNEYFLDVKVEPGDDRSLTVRHNELGLGTRFHPDIFVTTDCPVSWKRWCRQQLRWMRSSNRNFLLSLPFLCSLPVYIIFDDLYLFCFPFLLMVIVGKLVFQVGTLLTQQNLWQAYFAVLPYLITVFGLQIFKSFHLAYSQKNLKLLWLSCYFFIYLRYLIVLRIVSILTITHSEWTGRTSTDFLADQRILKGVNPM